MRQDVKFIKIGKGLRELGVTAPCYELVLVGRALQSTRL